MSGEKLSARQKMIGMMYLVLTAMLALNMSKEVLNAFISVDEGLRKTNITLAGKSSSTMVDFDAKSQTNPEKVGPYINAAKNVEDKSDELISYMEEMKARVMAASEKGQKDGKDYAEYMVDGKAIPLTSELIKKKDENQNNTALLIGPSPQKPRDDPFSALELQGKLESYRDFLKGIAVSGVDGSNYTLAQGIQDGLDVTFDYPMQMEQDKEALWVTANFYHVPLVAVVAQLTKLQVDVETAKANVLTDLISGIDAKAYKFTDLKPFLIPRSNYILRGDTFRAQVLLAAYDATNPPEIYVDGSSRDMSDSTALEVAGLETIPVDATGLGELKIPTNGMSMGEHSYKMMVNFKGPDGTIQKFPYFTQPFTVAEPALVISPTKMNVFYRGVPNPVEISVPGIPQDKLKVTCSGGHNLSKGSKGEWVIKPGKGKEAVFNVSATLPDGSTKSMGKKEFRVKRIPDPVPKFAGKKPSDNTVKKGDMSIAAGIRADMENFDFDVKVTVKSFNMIFIRDGQVIEKSSKSNRVTSEMHL